MNLLTCTSLHYRVVHAYKDIRAVVRLLHAAEERKEVAGSYRSH